MQTTPRLIPLPLYVQVLIGVACGALLGVVFGQESYLGGLRNEDLGGLGLLLVTLLKTLAIPLILVESTGFAILVPALYAVVAAGSPAGRSSTAQGLFGAAGTVGFIAASLIAGELAAVDIRLPFWMFVGTTLTTLAIGLAIGGRAIRSMTGGAQQPVGLGPSPFDASGADR